MLWTEYAELVAYYDELVEEDPSSDTYTERWQARIRHPSWEQKRQDFLWYTDAHCERCETRQQPKDLQLHHLHYDTLWYENNSDLELLCPSCHREADRERADEQAHRFKHKLSVEQRALNYMAIANKWSGQADWPVTYMEALERVTEMDDQT